MNLVVIGCTLRLWCWATNVVSEISMNTQHFCVLMALLTERTPNSTLARDAHMCTRVSSKCGDELKSTSKIIFILMLNICKDYFVCLIIQSCAPCSCNRITWVKNLNLALLVLVNSKPRDMLWWLYLQIFPCWLQNKCLNHWCVSNIKYYIIFYYPLCLWTTDLHRNLWQYIILLKN